MPLRSDEPQTISHTTSETEIEGEEVESEDDDDDEETEEQSTVNVRRSTRIRSKPSYLDDYVLLAEVECERLLMVINNEPWDYNEAKEMQVWIDACKDDLFSIEKIRLGYLLIYQKVSNLSG